MSEMTRSDRKDLATLARKRAKVATRQLDSRVAELEADLEEQLATEYSFDDDAVWAEAMRAAKEAVEPAIEDARIIVEQRCHELGIPQWARPEVVGGVAMTERGQNAVNERRTELRRTAKAKLAAARKLAAERIEASLLEIETELLAGGLESDEARRYVQAMPTPEQLLPRLDAHSLRREVEAAPKAKVDAPDRRGWRLQWERREELEEQGVPVDAELVGGEED